jgi:hypothetical protein
MTQLVPHTPVEEIIGYRDAAILKANEAIAMIVAGFAMMQEANRISHKAANNTHVYSGHTDSRHYRELFQSIDGQKAFDQFRCYTDACVWKRLYMDSGLFALMDSEARAALDESLKGDTPEVTVESAYERLSEVLDDRVTLWRRGLANTFAKLDPIFKSHDPYQFKRRVILTGIYNDFGMLNDRSCNILDDVERAFSVLDGKTEYSSGETRRLLKEARYGSGGARQTTIETPYYKVNVFKNGNVHLWFNRPDLVLKLNKELAAYFGSVLPDGVPTPEQNLRHKAQSTEVSKDLAFYPTPVPVIEFMIEEGLGDCIKGKSVLEPSAGEGAIVRQLLPYTKDVTAVEVDGGRCEHLRQLPIKTVLNANFLGMTSTPTFDCVVMNPPFCGTHYVSHVMHAYGFVKTGGMLWTILPATSRYSESGDHLKFREWAESVYSSRWYDLPAGSFKSSGTNINTVLLVLRKR